MGSLGGGTHDLGISKILAQALIVELVLLHIYMVNKILLPFLLYNFIYLGMWFVLFDGVTDCLPSSYKFELIPVVEIQCQVFQWPLSVSGSSAA